MSDARPDGRPDGRPDAMPDARQGGGSYQRIEVITGRRRRRRWSAEEKGRIVAESYEDGANISEVARRHGVARGLLTVWRHQVAARARGRTPSFVPIEVAPEGGGALAVPEPGRIPSVQPRLPGLLPEPPSGAIEIELDGARVRVGTGVELATLATVLSALRGER
jgi:transposase